jgi:predicted metal-dependent hydrolase
LIELLHDFVLFDGGVKKLPRVHQYFGIKAAQEHVRQKKGGIIWHTQGSGKSIVMVLLARWEPRINVKVARFFVQRMKTRWGSCNPDTGSIRLNTDLAKKPRQCLEYIVVHEMLHLLEPTHNARFVALMDQFMPRWQFVRETLNRLPVRHEQWTY